MDIRDDADGGYWWEDEAEDLWLALQDQIALWFEGREIDYRVTDRAVNQLLGELNRKRGEEE